MDATQILKEDHKRVKGLFDLIQAVDDFRKKKDVFLKLRDELTAHTFVEETIFYPAFASVEGFKGIVERSFEDHQEVKDLLVAMRDAMEDEFDALLDELIEAVEKHVVSEETEFFPRAKGALTVEQMGLLGDQIQETRQKRQAA